MLGIPKIYTARVSRVVWGMFQLFKKGMYCVHGNDSTTVTSAGLESALMKTAA